MAEVVKKPHGGFVFVPAMALLRAWWAYRTQIIKLYDLRVWLACFELTARRCRVRHGNKPRYTITELGKLVGGVGAEHLRHSIRRLESASLLVWTEHSISVLDGERLEVEDAQGTLSLMAELVVNTKRRVPVPRQVLKHLAAGERAVVIATVFGLLLRCVYYRRMGIRPDGLVKASWIAEVFGVHERNVKAARRELETMGLIRCERGSQYVLNRWGMPTVFQLAWRAPRADNPPPLGKRSTTKRPPLIETGNSSERRVEDQKPDASKPYGVRKRREGDTRLSRVTLCDLKNPERLQVLYEEAKRRHLLGDAESERLSFFAAAQRALRKGTTNAPGLFMWLLKRRHWTYPSQRDEEGARLILKQLPPLTARRYVQHTLTRSSNHFTREEVRALIQSSLASTNGMYVTDTTAAALSPL